MRFNKKHVISLVLAVAMVLSCIPAITPAASAEETTSLYDRPQGRSIVVSYDDYVGDDWAQELLDTLPTTVTLTGTEDTADVTWPAATEIAEIIKKDVVGFYYIPGTVNNVANAVTITIQVREYENLMVNGGFESYANGTTYGYPTDWNLSGGNPRISFINQRSGNSAGMITSTYVNQSTSNYSSSYTAVAAKVAEFGKGQYYSRVWACATNADENDPITFYGELHYNDTAQSSTPSVQMRTGSEITLTQEYQASYRVFNITNDAVVDYVSYYLKLNKSGSEKTFKDCGILVDDAELVALNVALAADVEPDTITGITTAAPKALAIAKNYDTYFEDTDAWQAGLDLLSAVEVTTSAGTDTVAVNWDYSNLDLTKTGRYVLTGTLGTSTLTEGVSYGNPDGLTVQQVIYVRESANLITNGDFADGKSGFGGSSTNTAADGDNAVLKYAHTTVYVDAVNQALYQSSKTTFLSTLKAAGVGQYCLSIDAKSVAYDSASEDESQNTARKDLYVRVTFRGWKKDATSVTSLASNSVAKTSLDTENWITAKKVFDMTQSDFDTYVDGMRTDVYITAGTASLPGAAYIDNLKLILIKQELTDLVEPEFYSASLTLQNNLAIRFNAVASQFGTDYTNPYAVFNFNGKEYKVDTYKETTDGSVAVYAFEFANIAPHQIADTVTATLCATYKGMTVSSDPIEYSVLNYCKNMMGKGDTKLDTLLADLLNYGAALQASMGETTGLVNEGMDLSAATADAPTLTSCTAVSTGNVTDPAAEWDSATLVLQDNVTVRLYFAAESADGLSVKITDGTDTLATITDIKQDAVNGVYYVDFDGLMATQMRTKIQATVCDANGAVSETVTYSVESYAAAHKDDTAAKLGDLVAAMMKYGDSAAAYAAAQN